jgi:hypothetical protein
VNIKAGFSQRQAYNTDAMSAYSVVAADMENLNDG